DRLPPHEHLRPSKSTLSTTPPSKKTPARGRSRCALHPGSGRHRLQLVSGLPPKEIGTEPDLVGQICGPRASEEAFGIAGVSAFTVPFRRNGTVLSLCNLDD